jgi:hypothetical protein
MDLRDMAFMDINGEVKAGEVILGYLFLKKIVSVACAVIFRFVALQDTSRFDKSR